MSWPGSTPQPPARCPAWCGIGGDSPAPARVRPEHGLRAEAPAAVTRPRGQTGRRHRVIAAACRRCMRSSTIEQPACGKRRRPRCCIARRTHGAAALSQRPCERAPRPAWHRRRRAHGRRRRPSVSACGSAEAPLQVVRARFRRHSWWSLRLTRGARSGDLLGQQRDLEPRHAARGPPDGCAVSRCRQQQARTVEHARRSRGSAAIAWRYLPHSARSAGPAEHAIVDDGRAWVPGGDAALGGPALAVLDTARPARAGRPRPAPRVRRARDEPHARGPSRARRRRDPASAGIAASVADDDPIERGPRPELNRLRVRRSSARVRAVPRVPPRSVDEAADVSPAGHGELNRGGSRTRRFRASIDLDLRSWMRAGTAARRHRREHGRHLILLPSARAPGTPPRDTATGACRTCACSTRVSPKSCSARNVGEQVYCASNVRAEDGDDAWTWRCTASASSARLTRSTAPAEDSAGLSRTSTPSSWAAATAS